MNRSATVSGDPEGGYVVNLHDGERHAIYPLKATGMDAALAEAAKRWDDDGATAAESDPPMEAQTMPAPIQPPTMEHPEQSDPHGVDVTRGRPGDETLPIEAGAVFETYEPQHNEHPLIPTAPGDTMAAGGDHEATVGEKLAMAENRAALEGDHTKDVGDQEHDAAEHTA